MTLDTAKIAPPPHEIQQLESDETAAGPAVEATAVETTVTTSGAMTVTGGGAGTVATGQFVNELTVQ